MSSSEGAPASGGLHGAWAAKIGETRETLAKLGVDITPRAISSSAAAATTSPVAAAVASAAGGLVGASAWNSAGTWEERTITSKAVPLLRERFLASRRALDGSSSSGSSSSAGSSSSLSLSFTSVTRSEGNVRVIFSRGKPRISYEFEKIIVEWAIVSGTASSSDGAVGAIAAGTATLTEVSDSDSDVFEGLLVTVSTATPREGWQGAPLTKDSAAAMVRKSESFFREIIKGWVEVLKSS